jgi:hypothetical protein
VFDSFFFFDCFIFVFFMPSSSLFIFIDVLGSEFVIQRGKSWKLGLNKNTRMLIFIRVVFSYFLTFVLFVLKI